MPLAGFIASGEITIDSSLIDDNLIDFPVLLNISGTSGSGELDVTAIFDHLGTDSKKIAVTYPTGSGEAECYCEIESWDNATEKAAIWANVPFIPSGEDTVLTFYYDNSHADNDAHVGETGDAVCFNVWDANFDAVWHCNALGVSGGFLDSTSNALAGNTVAGHSLIDALVGKAINFSGATVRIDSIGATGMSQTDHTCEFFCNPDGTTDQYMMDFGGDNNLIWNPNGVSKFNSYNPHLTPNTTYTPSNWVHIGYTQTGNAALQAYKDGVADGNNANASPAPGDLTVGTNPGGSYPFAGDLAEMRISSTPRPAAYMKATNVTLRDTLLSWTLGPTPPPPPWSGTTKILEVEHHLVDSELTDFPVMIRLAANCMRDGVDITNIFDDLGENNLRLKVETFDDETECYVEIQKWDTVAREAILWVKIPVLSAEVSTRFKLTWDPAHDDNVSHVGVAASTAAKNVWDADFDAVYHMSQVSGAGSILDSTINVRHGDPNGDVAEVDGYKGTEAIQFSGAGWLDGFVDSGMDRWNNTVETFLYPEWYAAGSGDSYILTHSSNDYVNHISVGTPKFKWVDPTITASGEFVDDQWYSQSITFEELPPASTNGDTILYIDGIVDAIASGTQPADPGALHVGRRDNGTLYFNGRIGEIRQSSVVRSAAWMRATDLSIRDEFINGKFVQATVTPVPNPITLSSSYHRINTTGIISSQDNLDMILQAAFLYQEDIKMLLKAMKTDIIDMMMDLRAISYIGLDNLVMYLEASDGTVMQDMSMLLRASPTPIYFSSYVTQRITSIKTDTGIVL